MKKHLLSQVNHNCLILPEGSKNQGFSRFVTSSVFKSESLSLNDSVNLFSTQRSKAAITAVSNPSQTNQPMNTFLQKVRATASASLAVLMFLVMFFFSNFAEATTYYVTPNGSGNGTSWANASSDLQLMINNASSGDEVWVASGTYKPTRNVSGSVANDNSRTFMLKDGVKVYGGFDGTETTLNQRNYASNLSILSGDFNADDVTSTFTNYSENAYHVVVAFNIGTATELNGFIIQEGAAVSGSYFCFGGQAYIDQGTGGGLFADSYSATTFTIKNVIFRDNIANNAGAVGSWGLGCAPIGIDHTLNFDNCTFNHNKSNGVGGAIYFEHTTSNLTRCIFNNNIAANQGGAIYSFYDGINVNSCIFQGNTAMNYAGAIGSRESYINCYNSIFESNTSNYGGVFNCTSAAPYSVNCTILNNNATTSGGVIYNGSGSTFENCIFWSNTSGDGTTLKDPQNNASNTVLYSVITQSPSTNFGGTGNVTGNPNFISTSNLIGNDAIWGTSDDGLVLGCGSSAFNTGSNTYVNSNNSTDIIGATRPSFSTADMGAYESVTNLSNSSITINTQPASSTQYCQNSHASALSVSATGSGLAYQWYSNAVDHNSNGILIAGATSSSYTPTTSNVGSTYYYCSITAGSCAIAVSSSTSHITVISTYTAVNNGNWQTASTWDCNSVPPSGADISINANVNLDASVTIGNLTINSGKTLDVAQSSNAINLNSGSTFTNNGTFVHANGNVNFLGSGTVAGSSTTTFKNVFLYGAVDFGLKSIVERALSLEDNGSINTNKPTYTTTTWLLYSGTGTHNVGLEWNTSGPEIAYLIVNPNATLSFGNMNSSRTTNSYYFSLQGTLSLSSASGGDLYINSSATQIYKPVNTNGRNIIFNRSGSQDLQMYSPSPVSFDNLEIDNGGYLGVAYGDLTITNSLTFTNGKLSAYDANLILANTANISGYSANKYIYFGGTTGRFTRNSIGNSVTLFPIGTGSSYNPLTISNGGNKDYTVKVNATAPTGTGISNATKMLSRQWDISSTGAATNVGLTFQYNNGEGVSGGSFTTTGSKNGYHYNSGTSTWDNIGTATAIGSNPYTVSYTYSGSSWSPFCIGNALSNNADLGDLSTTTGDIGTFASNATNYATCFGNALTGVNFTATLSDPNATFTYQFTGGAVTSGTSGTQISLNSFTGSSTTLTIVVTAEDGVTTKTYTIVYYRTPTATAASLSMCDDASNDGYASFNLTGANATVGSSQAGVTITYYASLSDAQSATNALTSPFTNTTANSQTIYARVANSGASYCYATSAVTLNVNPLPTLTNTTAFSCSGDPVNFGTANISPAGSSFTWVRNSSFVNSIGLITPTPNAMPLSGPINESLTNNSAVALSETYAINMTSGAGCVNPTAGALTLTIRPKPVASAVTSTQSICSGGSISNIAFTSNTSGTTYSWAGLGNNISGTGTTAGSNVAGPISGVLSNSTVFPSTYTYSITPSANGCSGNTFTASVVVNPTPTLSSTLSPSAVCSGTSFVYAPTSATPGATFTWTRATVTGISNAAANGTNNITETLINTTTSPVVVTYVYSVSYNGCTGTNNVNVTVNPNTTITGQPSGATYCKDATASALSVTAAGTGTITYQWFSNATNSNIGGTLVGSNQTFTPLTNTVGTTYYYALVHTDCGTDIKSSVVAVNVTPLTVITTQPVTATYCNNASATALTVLASGTGTITYEWFSNTTNSNTGGTTVGTGTSYTPSTASVGTTYYYVVATGSCGTVTSNAVAVNINTFATPSFISPLTSVCASSAGNVYTTESGNSNYIWSVSGGTITSGGTNSDNTATITWGSAGTGHVLINYSLNGCSATSPTDQTVTINALPTPTLSGNSTVCVGSTTQLGSAAATGGTVTYSGGYEIHTYTSSGTFNPSFSGNVEVLVVAGGGAGGAGNGGGGGGAGGLVYASSYAVTPGAKTVTIGAGGSGLTANSSYGNNGGNSVFDAITAIGGGGGGSNSNGPQHGQDGGSGGGIGRDGVGGIWSTSAAAGQALQTNSGGGVGYGHIGGYNYQGGGNGAGGGGGAGAVGGLSNVPSGDNGGVGGAGMYFAQFANAGYPSGWFAGGGGGASWTGGVNRAGGNGGGGNGGLGGGGGFNAQANTGGGGGGGWSSGNGGSGIVIVRFLQQGTNVWTIGDQNKATISNSGLVSGVSVGSTSVTLTVTDGNNCSNSTSTSIAVNSTPTIGAKTATICSSSGFSVTPSNGVDIVPKGTTYSWSAPTVTGITGTAAGSATTSISGTLVNTTNAPINVIYTVTPTSGSCDGTPFTVTVTVNPKPSISAKSTTVCSASEFIVTPTNGSDIVPSDITYSWAAPSVTGITGTASGSGATAITGTLTNITNAAINVIYIVTPSSGNCVGSPFNVTVTVSPIPSISAKTTTVCSASGFSVVPSNGSDIVPSGITYAWSAPSVTGITGTASGSGANSITGTLTNTTNSAIDVVYSVTPASGSCAGSAFNVTVTVNPKPTIAGTTATICSGASFSVTPTNASDIVPTGTTYSWSAPSVAGITGAASGSGASAITGTLTNSTNTSINVSYTITPVSGSCVGSSFTVTVTVNPKPTIGAKSVSVCSANSFNVAPANGSDVVPTGTTYTWTAPSVNGINGTVDGNGASSISGTLTNSTNAPINVVYSVTPSAPTSLIGTSYGGGIIAYVLQASDPGYVNGQTTAIIAAPSDQTAAQWGCIGTVIANTDNTAIGTGLTNSNNIISGCNTAGIAASVCRNLTTGGFSDWYLPSRDELAKLVINRSAIGLNGTFYWSSSQGIGAAGDYRANYAWGQFAVPNYRQQYYDNFYGIKQNANSVRAIRIATVSGLNTTCDGTPFNVTVTVNPVPTVANKTTTICNGASFSVTPTNGSDLVPVGTTYSWSAPSVAGITGTTSGANSASISGTLNNTTNSPIDVVYTITPSIAGCAGGNFTLTVTVNPTPSVASIGLSTVEILAVGAGGGAGGPDGIFGAGGGAGGVVYAKYNLISGSNTFTVAVGGAGQGGLGCNASASGGLGGTNGGGNGGAAGNGGCSGGGGGGGGWSGFYQGSTYYAVAGGGAGGGGSNEGTANNVVSSGGGTQTSNTGNMNGGVGATFSGDGGGGAGGGGGYLGGSGQTNLNASGTSNGGTNFYNASNLVTAAAYVGNVGAANSANLTSTIAGGVGTTNTISNATDFNYTNSWGKGGDSQNQPQTTGTAGAGTAGAVVIRYAGTPQATGGTITQSGGYTLHTFTTPGISTFTINSAVCVGSTLQLTSATSGGVWSTGNSAIATVDANGLVTGVAAGNVVITYTVTVNGCVNSVSSNITVNPLPTASISGSTAVCQNAGSPNVTFTGAAGTAPYTFVYKVNNGSNQTVTTTIGNSVTVAQSTGTANTFIYTLISVSDANGCGQTQSGTATILVNPLPAANISGTTSVCKDGTSPIVTFTGSNGTAPYTFTYKIGSGSNQTITTTSGNTVTVTAPTSTVGTYTYSLVSVQDASSTSCVQSQSGTAVITVDPIPTASAGGSTTICSNGSATVSGATSSNGAIFWTHNGAGTLVNPTTIAPTYHPVAADAGNTVLLTMTVTSNNSCGTATATATYTVHVDPLPTASAGGSQTICSNATATISGASATNGTILWTVSSSSSFPSTIVVPAVGGCCCLEGTYTYESMVNGAPRYRKGTTSYLVMWDGTKWVNTEDAIVSNLPSSGFYKYSNSGSASNFPTNWNISSGVCGGGSTTLTVSGSLGGSITSGATTLTPTYTPAGTDAGHAVTLNMTVTSNNSCAPQTATASYTVNVNPITALTVQPTGATYCQSATATALTTTGTGTGTVTYQWFNNGTTNSNVGGSLVGSAQTYTPSTNAAGATYYYAVIHSDCGPDIKSNAVAIIVNPKPIIASTTSTICSNGTFTVTPVNGTDIIPSGTTYAWSLPSATSITGAAAGSGANAISGTLTNTSNASQVINYIVTPTAATGSCAGAAFTVAVTVNPKPAIAAKTATICSDGSFSVTPSNGGDIVPTDVTYAWSAPSVTGITGTTAGSGATAITGTLTNTTNAVINVVYSVTPTSGSCTGSAFNVTVTVNPKPAIAAKTQTICSNASFSLTPSNGTDIVPTGTTYDWTAPSVTGITGTASGTGASVIAGSLVNTTNDPIDVVYVVTPTSGSCIGSAFNYTVKVVPAPILNTTSANACSGVAFGSAAVFTNANVQPTGTFTWTRNASAYNGIGLINAPVGSNHPAPIAETLTSTSSVPLTETYTLQLTTTAGGCTATINNFPLTLNPKPVATATPATQFICSGTAITDITLSSTVNGTTYSWTSNLAQVPEVTGIADANNVAGLITGTLTNSSTLNKNRVFTIVPSANGCSGNAITAGVTVNPSPVLSSTLTPSAICSGTNFSYTPTSLTPGATFTWTRAANSGISNSAGSGSASVNEALVNTTTAPITVRYVYSSTYNNCTGISNVDVVVNPKPQLSEIHNNVACNGLGNGSIDLTVAGATAPNTYVWTGSTNFTASTEDISNLNPGTYTVTVTDNNGCVSNPLPTVTITQPIVVTVNASKTNVTCHGANDGTITITGLSAGATTTIKKDGTGADLSGNSVFGPGTYVITASAPNGNNNGNCTATTSVTILEPSVVSVGSVTQNTIGCNGSNATVNINATGGTGALSYTFDGVTNSTGIFTHAAGSNLSYSVTDANACAAATGTFTITQPSVISVSSVAQSTIACNGQNATVTITATGGTGTLSYTFDGVTNTTGIFSHAAGSNLAYSVTDANHCSAATGTFTIVQPPTVTVSNVSQSTIACNGQIATVTITAAGGTGTLAYTFDGITNSTGIFTHATGTGLSYSVTDANACAAATGTFSVVQPAAITVSSVTQSAVSCNGQNATVTIVATGGTGALAYTFDGITNSTGIFAHPAGAALAYSVTDANSCAAAIGTYTVTQPAALALGASSKTDATCFGTNTGSVTAGTVSNAVGALTYNWTNASSVSVGSTATVTGLPAGTYTLTVVDQCSTRSNSVTIGQPAAALALGTSSKTDANCFGTSTGSVTAGTVSNAIGTVHYTWTNAANATVGSTATVNNLPAGTYTLTVTDDCSTLSNSVIIGQPAAVTVSNVSQSTIACNGQIATVTITAAGGTGALSYTFDNQTNSTGIFTHAAGTGLSYSVTDANACAAATGTFSVVQPSVISVSSVTQSAVTCNGQNATVTIAATGGTGTLAYTFDGITNNTGIFTHAAGSNLAYSVTDANSCAAAFGTYTVTQPAALALGASSKTDATCFGTNTGSVTAGNVSNAVGALTYNWTNASSVSVGSTATVTGLPAGTYTLTVVDQCSTRSNSVTIGQPAAALALGTSSKTDANCFGTSTGSVTAGTVSNAIGAVHYTWTNAASATVGSTATVSNLPAGTYTLTVTDDCSTLSNNVTIGQPSAVTVSNVSQSTIACNGQIATVTITAAGGTGALSYTFDNQTNSTGIFTHAAGTGFSYSVTDANACAAATGTFSVVQPSVISVNSVTQSTVTCNGQNATVTIAAAGGTGALAYTFDGITNSTGIFAHPAGAALAYSVTDANSCAAAIGTYTVTQPAALALGASSKTDATCFGTNTGSVTAGTVSNAVGALTYNWTNASSVSVGSTATVTGLPAGTYTLTVVDQCSTRSNSVTIGQPAAALALGASSKTDVTCFGANTGSVSAGTVSNAIGSVTYQWKNALNSVVGSTATVNNLPAGTYTLRVTDACSTVSNSVVIGQPVAGLALGSSSKTDVTCFGTNTGSVTAGTVSNAVGAVTYTWKNASNVTVGSTATVNNLTAGTYTLTVADNCASLSTNVTITQPVAALSLGASSKTDVTCFGTSTGSVTAGTVSNAVGTVVYTWKNASNVTVGSTATVSGLPAGTYTLTAADNCSNLSNSVTIGQPAAALTLGASSKVDVTCFGASTGSVTSGAISNAVGTVTYTWKNSSNVTVGSAATVSSLPAGTYTLTVTDNCSTVSNSVTIGQPASALALAASSKTDATCFGTSTGSITAGAVTNAVGTVVYVWKNAANTTVGNTATVNNLPAGTYTLTVSDACSTRTNTVTIGQPVAVGSPIVGTITQTTCTSATGSVVLTGLPASGNWTLSNSFNSATVNSTGTSYTWTGLTAGTYTFTVSNGTCSSVASSSATISTQPGTASAPVIGTVTQPGCTSLTGTVQLTGLPATGSWTITESLNQTTLSGSGTTANFTGLGAGIYNFTISNGSCTSAPSLNATINTPPTTAIAFAAVSVTATFPNSNVRTVSNAGSSGEIYYVSIDNGAFVQQNIFPYTIGGLSVGSHTLKLKASNLAGTCVDIATTNFTITTSSCIAVAGINLTTSASQPLSGNNFIFLNGSVLNGPGSMTYSWDLGDNTTTTNTSPYGHTYLNPGVYVVTLTASTTTGGGCSSTTSTVVTVTGTNAASFTYNQNSCANRNVTFTSTSSGATSYSWNFGDNTPAVTGTATPTHTYAKDSSYSVVLTINGTTASAPQIVSIVTAPVVGSIVSSGPVGCGNVYTFTNTTPGNNLTYAWTFSGGTGATSTSSSATRTYSNASAQTVDLIVTAGNRCPASAARLSFTSVAGGGAPQAVLTVGAASTPSATSKSINNTGSTNATRYFVQLDAGSYVEKFTFPYDITGLSNGSHTVNLKATDASGNCFDIATNTFTITSTPCEVVASINLTTPSTQALATNNFVFLSTSTSQYGQNTLSFSWDLGDNSPLQTGSAIYGKTYANPGNYVVTLTATSSVSNCSSVTTQRVVVTSPNNASANFSFTPNTCGSRDVTFSSTSTGATSYSWNFGDNTALVTGTATPTHTYATTGSYTVVLTINGNIASAPQTVNVVGNPVPGVITNGGPSACGSQYTFTSNATGTNLTYAWTFSGGTGATSTSATATRSYASASAQTVDLVVTADGRCSANAPQLSFNSVAGGTPPPTAAFTVANLGNNKYEFTNTTTGTATSFTWNWGDNSAVTTTTLLATKPQHVYGPAGTYNVTLTAFSGTCSTTYVLPVTVANTIVTANASFTIDKPVQCISNNSFTFLNNTTINGWGWITSNVWSFSDGSPNITNTSVYGKKFNAAGVITVTLTVTLNTGATSTTSFDVTVASLPCTGVPLQTGHPVNSGGSHSSGGTVAGATGIADVTSGVYNLNLFPNPNNGTFTLDVSQIGNFKDLNITIIDMLGREVYNHNRNVRIENQLEFTGLNLSSGKYNVILTSEGHTVGRAFFAVTGN